MKFFNSTSEETDDTDNGDDTDSENETDDTDSGDETYDGVAPAGAGDQVSADDDNGEVIIEP